MSLGVVFDSSTLINAAIRPGCLPDRALSHTVLFHRVFVSEPTLSELAPVLREAKFSRYVSLESRIEFFQKLCRDSICWNVPAEVLESIGGACRDPKDEQFLGLCLAANANLLVSSDADLLILNPWMGIPILTPAEFLQQLSA